MSYGKNEVLEEVSLGLRHLVAAKVVYHVEVSINHRAPEKPLLSICSRSGFSFKG